MTVDGRELVVPIGYSLVYAVVTKEAYYYSQPLEDGWQHIYGTFRGNVPNWTWSWNCSQCGDANFPSWDRDSIPEFWNVTPDGTRGDPIEVLYVTRGGTRKIPMITWPFSPRCIPTDNDWLRAGFKVL